jgi:hypothetical protein
LTEISRIPGGSQTFGCRVHLGHFWLQGFYNQPDFHWQQRFRNPPDFNWLQGFYNPPDFYWPQGFVHIFSDYTF